MKEKEESPGKKPNETEANNLLDIEFKVMVVGMLKEVSEDYKELSGNYNSIKKEIGEKKEIEIMNKNQKKINTISDIKNTVEGPGWCAQWLSINL